MNVTAAKSVDMVRSANLKSCRDTIEQRMLLRKFFDWRSVAQGAQQVEHLGAITQIVLRMGCGDADTDRDPGWRQRLEQVFVGGIIANR